MYNIDEYLIRSGDLYGGVEFLYKFPNNYTCHLAQNDGTKNYWSLVTYYSEERKYVNKEIYQYKTIEEAYQTIFKIYERSEYGEAHKSL